MSKVALITGGSKRIGKAIVMALWNEGWDVIIHFNESTSDAKKLMQNLNHKRSDSARCIKANLDNEKEIKYLIDESIKQFGIHIFETNHRLLIGGSECIVVVILKYI